MVYRHTGTLKDRGATCCRTYAIRGIFPSVGMEEQLEADLRKLERKMIRIHGEQFEPDCRPRCDVTRSATFADVAATERKRRDEERRAVKNQQSMYRDQLIKTYKPLLDEELRKIDEHLPQVGTPAHRKLLTKIRTQIFARVRTVAIASPIPTHTPRRDGSSEASACARSELNWKSSAGL